MDLLLIEAPLDAFAFRLHFLPAAAASLWTWVAVVTAALGLWCVRSLGFKPDSSPPTTSPTPSTPPIERSDESVSPSHREDAGESSEIRYVEDACSPRNRFTAYYYCGCAPSSQSCCVEEETDNVDDDEVEAEAEEDAGGMKADGKVTRAAVAMWNGVRGRRPVDAGVALRDLGWYQYQDLAALNGSVVRLWDGGRDGLFTATATATATAAGFRSRGKY